MCFRNFQLVVELVRSKLMVPKVYDIIRVRISGLEMLVFRKIFRTYLRMIPDKVAVF